MASIRKRRPGRPVAAHYQPSVQQQTARANANASTSRVANEDRVLDTLTQLSFLHDELNVIQRSVFALADLARNTMLGNQSTILESIPVTLETIQRKGGSHGKRPSKRTGKTLSLFPLAHKAACKGETHFKRPRNNRRQKSGPQTLASLTIKSSSFKGVSYYKRTGRWEAQIWKKGKQISLGASSTEEKAARAYDRAAIHFHKIGAVLNFKWDDYKGELPQLMEISEDDLTAVLRKQSAGEGTTYPVYPPLQGIQPVLKFFGAPRKFLEIGERQRNKGTSLSYKANPQ